MAPPSSHFGQGIMTTMISVTRRLVSTVAYRHNTVAHTGGFKHRAFWGAGPRIGTIASRIACTWTSSAMPPRRLLAAPCDVDCSRRCSLRRGHCGAPWGAARGAPWRASLGRAPWGVLPGARWGCHSAQPGIRGVSMWSQSSWPADRAARIAALHKRGCSRHRQNEAILASRPPSSGRHHQRAGLPLPASAGTALEPLGARTHATGKRPKRGQRLPATACLKLARANVRALCTIAGWPWAVGRRHRYQRICGNDLGLSVRPAPWQSCTCGHPTEDAVGQRRDDVYQPNKPSRETHAKPPLV
jgi:hypothetical protein